MAIRPELKGVALMLAGIAFLSVNDAVSKYLAERHPLGQVVFLRQLAGLMFALPYALATTGWASFRIVNHQGQMIRAVVFVGTSVLMLASLANLPLAIATAIAFSSPLWVAAFAGPMLGEAVATRRWLAILAGFAGVLIIIRPGGASFTWALLLPVATAMCNAARDMMTRKLASTDSSISILLWGALLSLAVSALALPFGWQEVTALDWAWFLIAGFLNIGAHFLMISAYRHADASALSPYRYTSLIWAIGLGWLFWSHLPDAIALFGTAVVIVAAAFALDQGGPRTRTAHSSREAPADQPAVRPPPS